VKGVDIEIFHDVWTAITGLKYTRLRINKGNIGVVEEFNKMRFYKRLTAFIISWMLTPRGNNHSTLSEEDLVLIYCIMHKVKLN